TAWSFHSAGQLVFGRGAVAQLGELVARRRLRSVLVVTDRRLATAGLVERVLAPLAAAGIATHVFDEGEPEPSIAVALRAADAAARLAPDCVLGLGGGSNMDLAKITAILITHGGPPSRYFGFGNVPGPVLPLVCVPTTAGTGSEVSHAAVLTDTENHIKVSTLSQFLRPALALVDPALTDSCPRQVTADSGIDALTHAIEAYTATDYQDLEAGPHEPVAYEGRHPLGMCLAEKAIALIGEHLVTAVKDGANRAARDGMALAATVAGLAFSNCAVALVHALEYPLGAVLHCSHGAGNGLLLPHVMRYNLSARAESQAAIARLLGENVAGLSSAAAAERAIAAVQRIARAIGIPQRIRDLGGNREQLPVFAEKAFAIKRLMNTNPRRPTQADLLAILEAAF
ncbi:MAG TPA: iron-containing alcohol dehydrogenase, partial [Pirellulaceae bacterium]|nr:iron-containing alcohol dehydrogenase [Pirellulaceae bacterium]